MHTYNVFSLYSPCSSPRPLLPDSSSFPTCPKVPVWLLGLFCFCFVLFYFIAHSLVYYAYILKDIEPSNGVWLTYQRPHIQRKGTLPSPEALSSKRLGRHLPLPCWNISQIGLVEVFLHVAVFKTISTICGLNQCQNVCLPCTRTWVQSPMPQK